MLPSKMHAIHSTLQLKCKFNLQINSQKKFVRCVYVCMLGFASHFVVTNWFKLMLNSNKNDLQRLRSHTYIFKQCRTCRMSSICTHDMVCVCVFVLRLLAIEWLPSIKRRTVTSLESILVNEWQYTPVYVWVCPI